MAKPIDLTGQVFGTLTAIRDCGMARAFPNGTSLGRVWLCRCECGRYRIETAGKLRGGIYRKCWHGGKPPTCFSLVSIETPTDLYHPADLELRVAQDVGEKVA